MPHLIHDFITRAAERTPNAPALLHKDRSISYGELQAAVVDFARGLRTLGTAPGERIAVYLPKQLEMVVGLFGAAHAGASFVPINPGLKPLQLAHILPHCNAGVLLTSVDRFKQLREVLPACPDLHTIVLTGEAPTSETTSPAQTLVRYQEFMATTGNPVMHRRIDADMAAILYTSGSTGNAKGVILSHRNLVAGAHSVSSYLGNTASDRILAVLPLSFDAGLSQLTTAFAVGASAVLLDYLLPRDIVRAIERHQITGVTGVPPLWNQLRELHWPEQAQQSLRYIASTGGAMPVATTQALRNALPTTDIYLMYGLTEAFRSTYLPPEQVDQRPQSIGKAIPNAEVLVINNAGEECAANEVGELVHRGALVSMGYWRDPEKTAERFRPAPCRSNGIPTQELAVWSGDRVRRDEEGYLYFVGRQDEMIKTSGYRVSPTEVEDVALSHTGVQQAVALGLPHAELGEGILLLVTATQDSVRQDDFEAALASHCRVHLPNFMLPLAIQCRDELPRNQNGKLDRAGLKASLQDYFMDSGQ